MLRPAPLPAWPACLQEATPANWRPPGMRVKEAAKVLNRMFRQEERSHHQLQPGGGIIPPAPAGDEGASGSGAGGSSEASGGGGSGAGASMPDDMQS